MAGLNESKKDKCSKCLSCYVLFGRNFRICLFGNGHFLVSTQIGSFIPYMDHYTDSDWTSSQYFSNFMVPKQFQRNTYNQKNAIRYVVQVKVYGDDYVFITSQFSVAFEVLSPTQFRFIWTLPIKTSDEQSSLLPFVLFYSLF